MRPALTFHDWLSVRSQLDETAFHFGKYQGIDISDPEVPLDYLQWAYEKLTLLRPDFRREIEDEINKRGGSAAGAQPRTPPPAPQRPKTPPPEDEEEEDEPQAGFSGKVRGVFSKMSRQPQQPAHKIWYKARVVGGHHPSLKAGQDVAMSKRSDNNWDFITLDAARTKGILPGEGLQNIVKSYRDDAGKPVQLSPEQLEAPKPEEPAPVESKAEPGSGKLRFLPDEILDKGAAPGEKTEGRRIDDQFKENLANKDQSHIMINALAGSGKTTMLRHLAWKYGKPGQKWLYLVFNTKNRVEAKEDFPQWVDVQTTNSFLGHLLNDRKNITALPQTDLMARMKGDDDDDDKIVEKGKIISDSPEFFQLMSKAGIPPVEELTAEGRDQYEQGALKAVGNQIIKGFKKATLILVGLAKSYGVDPRNDADMRAKLKQILKDYDIDTTMAKAKERVQKYSPYFGSKIRAILRRVMGYDFMSKDYKDEIQEATVWMLHETLPNNTQLKHTRGGIEFELGQFRDFHDDLWFAAIHANQLHWPHYDVVLADEVQDFNEAQKIMLQKLHEAGAKIVAVGDPNQAIYRFRGADGQAFNNLGKMLTERSKNKNVMHSLSKNFRSRRNIIDFVNHNTVVNNLIKGKEFPGESTGPTEDKEAASLRQYLQGFTPLISKDIVINILQRNGAPEALVKKAQVILPGTQRFRDVEEVVHAFEKNNPDRPESNPADGVVTKGDIKYGESFDQLAQEKAAGKIEETAYIARTNEPLVHAALSLLGRGIPFVIVGRDVAGNLVKHVERIMNPRFGGRKLNDNATVEQLREALQKHLESEKNKYETHATQQDYLKELDDITLALVSAIHQFAPDLDPQNPNPNPEPTRAPTIGKFKQWLKAKLGGFDVQESERDLQAFRDKVKKEHPVILTTAHKAKGLEFSRVYILRNDLFPHPTAHLPPDVEQEENARYVAYTRAKDQLHILNLEGQPGYKK